MFGKKKIQELEYRLSEANKDLDKANSEIKDLEGKLSASQSRSTESFFGHMKDEVAEIISKASGLEALLSTEQSRNSDLEKDLTNANYQIADLEQNLSTESLEVAELEKKIGEAMSKISDLESGLSEMTSKNQDLEKQLAESELEEIREQARTTQIEFEGMRDLYNRKVKEFDDTIEEKEQALAREDALQRYHLENEIRENKQENEILISNTVKKFSESYNYYLNQIKLLMDALGDVAVQTGQGLFSESDSGRDLKGLIGENMAAILQSETGSLRDEEDGMVLIGKAKSPEDAGEADASEGEEPAPAPDAGL